MFPLRVLAERELILQLVRVVASPAMGISAREFSSALITAQQSIGYPKFFEEKVWDASEELLTSPLRTLDPMESATFRYSFLWQREEFIKREEQSWLWKQLKSSVPDIERRYRYFLAADGINIRKRLLTTVLVLEERMRELIGATGLMHSAYYSNPRVIEKIAEFIAAQSNKRI